MNLSEQVVLVLWQPQDLVNIAGVVRVMTNFGLARLRLVQPAEYDPWRVEGVAHRVGPVLQRAQVHETLAEALADCSLVLGATARSRELQRVTYGPREAAPRLLAAGTTAAPAAIVFGREDTGLDNASLEHCHAHLTIPTAPENASLNLAQAAAVCAYELWLAAQAPPPPAAAEPSTGAEREEAFAALERVLRLLYVGDTPEGRFRHALARLRALILRAEPSREEAGLLARLFRHIARRLEGG